MCAKFSHYTSFALARNTSGDGLSILKIYLLWGQHKCQCLQYIIIIHPITSNTIAFFILPGTSFFFFFFMSGPSLTVAVQCKSDPCMTLCVCVCAISSRSEVMYLGPEGNRSHWCRYSG